MWDFTPPKFFFLLSFASAAIQFPSAAIDLFMFLASSSFLPLLKVLESRSEPAKSTIVRSPFFKCFFFTVCGEAYCFWGGELEISIHLYSINIYITA